MAKAKLPQIKTVVTCHWKFKGHANSSISFLWGSTSSPVEITMLTFLKVFMVTGWKGVFFHYISITHTSEKKRKKKRKSHLCKLHKNQLIKYISISTNFQKHIHICNIQNPNIFFQTWKNVSSFFFFFFSCDVYLCVCSCFLSRLLPQQN